MTERIHHAGIPIHDDDETIRQALADVSIPTLLCSMVHMTGDTSILDGPLRPQGIYLNEVQGFMSAEDQAAVRTRAVEVIKAYRDGGCRLRRRFHANRFLWPMDIIGREGVKLRERWGDDPSAYLG
ncbi:MAG: hypothetical protein ACR2P8_11645, partial [Myxococcota bacterium]